MILTRWLARSVLVVLLAGYSLIMGVSCQTSSYDLGQTGNVTLSTLGFMNMPLIAPVMPVAYNPFYSNFNRHVTNYSIVQSTNTRFKIVVMPDLVWTKFTVNGVRVKMETNSIGYPTYTDVTHLLKLSTDSNTYTVNLKAEDGSTRDYVVRILDSQYDASMAGMDLSSGAVYPKFSEGSAPYFANGANGTNCYRAVADDNFKVTVRTVNPSAQVRIRGVSVSPGVEYAITIPPGEQDGQWYDYPVQVVSQNGYVTNNKLLKLAYIKSTDDSRLTDLVLNGGQQKLSVPFYFGTLSYSAIFDDVETLNLSITKAQATSKVFVDKGDGLGYGAEIGASQKTVAVSGIQVKMSGLIKIKVESESGAKSTEYMLNTMVFTSKPYDFDGGIKKYIEDVRLKGEYTPPTPIEGIITVRDYYGYNDAYYCFFVQDKNAGLYIFLSLMGNPNRVDLRYKVGHRVKFIATKSKNYYGQMEAVEFSGMTFADGTTEAAGQVLHPVYVISGPDFYNNSHQGKMMRVKQKVGVEINSRKVGYFENNTPFHINNPSVYAKILPKLQVGMGGTFYGPVLYGWYINQLEFVNEDYCIFD